MIAKRIAKLGPCLAVFVFFNAFIGSVESHGEITLYDNTGIQASRFEHFVHPQEAWFLAQPFRTDEQHRTITSVTVPIGKFGAPSGEMRFSIWDDNGGVPGQMIGQVGAIEDVNFLPSRGFGQVLEEVTFSEMTIPDLMPNSTYFVVLDLTEADSSPFLIGGCGPCDGVMNAFLRSTEGTNGAGSVLGTENSTSYFDVSEKIGRKGYLQMAVEAVSTALPMSLHAGDADQDLDFDQLDLVQVQVAAKYLTGQIATWGEGDWNGAPGGTAGDPPLGNGLFDQLDVITALAAGTYLTGPYSAVQANGTIGDGQTSVIYNAGTGELAVDAPAGIELTSINVDSSTGIFTAEAAANLGGSFDNDADSNIFKAMFGGNFGSVSFGHVAQTGLSEEFVIGDLSVVGSLAGGGNLGNVDLVYVPEPASVLLLSVGLAIALVRISRTNR